MSRTWRNLRPAATSGRTFCCACGKMFDLPHDAAECPNGHPATYTETYVQGEPVTD